MSKQSKLTLLIDGNWLLMSRFAVLSNQYASDEELCKQLQLLMLKSINLVLRTFPEIDNIIFVSDGGSWRSDIDIPQFLYNEIEEGQPITYKGQRHLSEEFNWNMIFQYYEELILKLEENGITTCRTKNIEGDDWCWYWSTKLNKEGTNCFIWSMDKDLTQLVNMNEDDGVFTICWDSKTGLKCSKIINDNNPLDFFFNDPNKEYNNRIFESILNKCSKITEINNKEIIIDKIIRGDSGDNIFPIILKKSNKPDSTKKFRVSQKDLDFNINLNNDNDIKNYIHKLMTSKKYMNKVNKSEENIFEHFKYNYKLIVLDKNNYPKDILNNMNSYSGYYINKNIQPVLSYYMAQTNNVQNILENI